MYVSGERVPKSQVQTATVRPLDKSGFIPLYYQIQRALMEKIHSGELLTGDPLASEEELARVYQVSRMTARQALHGLKTSGFAISQKGRGTFVTRPKLDKNIMHLRGFTEDMKHLGMVPSSKLLEQTVIKATEELAEKLKVAAQRIAAEVDFKVPVLFTAHSVPTRTIVEGDPYERQCHETAGLVARACGHRRLSHESSAVA